MKTSLRRRIFIRNISGRDQLELLLVSAVSSLLLLRFVLHLLGYPSVGGAKYHIGHMLWGGIIMLAAIVVNFAFLGSRVQKVVALLGGVGFGIFIDELGKFVTRDANYFFRPAVGMIYAVFVIMYLVISYVTREQKLTTEEYQLNALRQIEEAIHDDLSESERLRALALLDQAGSHDELTRALQSFLATVHVIPARISRYGQWRQRLRAAYKRLWMARSSHRLVRWFFIVETMMFLAAVLGALYTNADDVTMLFTGNIEYGQTFVLGQLGSTVLAGVCVVVGLGFIGRSRLRAFEWFRRATLINLLLTEFFLFGRVEFAAMPSFLFNLVLLSVISAALYQERETAESAEADSFKQVHLGHNNQLSTAKNVSTQKQ